MIIYTAITIGPIYKTLQQAKRVREAWQASYFFSFIMKSIVVEAKKHGQIILPAENDDSNFYGAGIFPDRLIMSSNNEFDVNENIIKPALLEVSKKLKVKQNLLEDFLNIHHIQIEQNTLISFELLDDENEIISSYIHKLNYLLNVQELNITYSNSDVEFFKDLFEDQTRKAFYDIAYQDKKHRFNSIFEITAQGSDLIKTKVEALKNEDDIDKILFKDDEVESKLSKHQKYLAILRADGDNFGKVISAISHDNQLVTKFSEDLVKFSQEASKIIHEFGGTIIYIGGDDILAFCPLVNKEKTVFQIIKTLNSKFNEIFKDEIYIDNKVSISYGLSISYYKYPLNEALDISYDLLMNKAKNEPLKNCIAFQILQNSGSLRETILNFEKGENFDSFIEMLVDVNEKGQLLQSLTHQLIEDENLLKECLKSNRIDGYFDNHYNPNNKKSEVKNFIVAMQDNLKANYSVYKKTNENLEKDNKKIIADIENKALKQMNTIAKMINFLND